MRLPSLLAALAGAALLAGANAACSTRVNYLDPGGPRYAASYAALRPATVEPERILKVVSYNVRYGEEIEAAIDVLTGTRELADADLLLLQEMSPLGVDRIADALGCGYVYYPATLRSSGREFGNAVLARAPILADRKTLLPHVNPLNRQHRIAVHAEVELGAERLHACSVHTETPMLPMEARAAQLEELLRALPDGAAPCLVAGDFNTMSERSLREFRSAFARRGFHCATAGLAPTFDLGPFGYVLDHVFVRGFEVVDAGVVADAHASDHRPVWVELRRTEPGPTARAGARVGR